MARGRNLGIAVVVRQPVPMLHRTILESFDTQPNEGVQATAVPLRSTGAPDAWR